MTIRELWDALGQNMADKGSGSNKLCVGIEDRIYEATGVRFAGNAAIIEGGFVDGSPRRYPNGNPMFGPDGTMLDKEGNRSIFDDVDE